jgi:hypothetical protein
VNWSTSRTGRAPSGPGKATTVLVQREMEKQGSPLMSDFRPCGRGFSRHKGLPIRLIFEMSARRPPALDHRLDEPTRLSLGMVASLQSPLPFRLARSLYRLSAGLSICILRSQLTTNLALLPSRFQLTIALLVDLLLPACQHVCRRDIANGAV